MAKIRTLAEIKREFLRVADKAPRGYFEEAIEYWIRLNKPRLSMADIQKVNDYVASSATEGLIHFINENFTDEEYMSYSFKGVFDGVDITDRQLMQHLIDAWLMLEESPEHDVAQYWVGELTKELESRSVKINKEKELRRKKREIAQGLGNIDQSSIDYALETVKDSDEQMRVGAARFLALLCAEGLNYYIRDSENRLKVAGALKGALKDSNSSVRYAAKEGLKLLRKR